MPIYRLNTGYEGSRCCNLPYCDDDTIVLDVTGYNYTGAIYRGKRSTNRNTGANTTRPLRWYRRSLGRMIEIRPAQSSYNYSNMHYRYIFRLGGEKVNDLSFVLETPDDVMPNIREALRGHHLWVSAIPSYRGTYLWEVKW